MRLFLCIFDKVLGRRGFIATSRTPEQSQTNLREVEPRRGFDSRCDRKELKFGRLAFYGED